MGKTEQKVFEFVERHHLIQNGDLLVAGISGGADSVSLFYLLKELQKKIAFSFVAVHINHNLRGQEGDRDQHFVEQLCEKEQIPLYVVSEQVKFYAEKHGCSLEEAGRMIRYRAFDQVKKEIHGNKIVLAHHQDDLAETMIHHLVRGTGITGLCGIKPVSGQRIRPLLCLTRKEIEEFLCEKHLVWQTDSSNLEDDYTRNKIRHHVMDYLCEEINPRAASHMAETAAELLEVDLLLNQLTENARSQWIRQEEKESHIAEELRKQPELIQRRIFLEEMKRIAGVEKDFTRIHGEDVVKLWNRQVGKKICLPYQLLAERTYEGIRIVPNCIKEKDISENLSEKEMSICVPGVTYVGEYVVSCEIVSSKTCRIVEKTYTKWLDYDKICDSLSFRHRKTGDRIRIHPSGGGKKLKDYFIDRKIPRQLRDKLWLLADGSEIMWIIGDRISERYKVSDTTCNILRIEIKGGNIHE